jgi:flavin reductase (DIM6/NTAB) family NADH-FMN oxidoreductase RutF
MSKVIWKPGTLVYPVPAVMVSCGNEKDGYNIITIAWTGTICTDPAMAYISIRPDRYSYDIIKKNGDFVINLTTKDLVKATDWCGVRSGRDYDKFKEMELTPVKASQVGSPLIEECPINIECRVKEIIELGSHHMFLAEVVAVNASTKYLDKQTQSFDMEKAGLISYIHGKYYGSTTPLGKFGYSIQKKKKERWKKKMRPETRRAEPVSKRASNEPVSKRASNQPASKRTSQK